MTLHLFTRIALIRMVSAAALSASAVLLASPGFAAAKPAKVSAATASMAAKPAAAVRPFQFALQNGLQVLVLTDRRAPVVTQMLWFRTGAVDDPPGLSGMAHFFEHMMFRGTRGVPGNGFARAVTRAGGEDNAFTTADYTMFYERVGKDHLRQMMHLEADRMRDLILTETTVATERDVILAERRQRIDNDPAALAEEQAMAALYLSHPYGRPVIGWAEEIRRIGRAEAADFYYRHYAPNNAILVVAGDVSPDEVRAAAEAEYGALPARNLVARTDYAQAPRLGETRLNLAMRSVKVPAFLRYYRVSGYADAAPGRAESLEVFTRMLGGDTASALYRVLVLERHLATTVSASYDGYARDGATLRISAEPRPGVSLDVLERTIDEVIAAFVRHGPGKTDLARAKKQMVASTILRRDNQYEMATAYGRALVIGLTAQDVQMWPARISAVSGDGVRKAAATLTRKEAVSVFLTPGR